MDSPRVLVVDDNAENRALAEATLSDEGYGVTLATGGEEGLKAFDAQRPDCVLLDVRMPGTDGFEVCAKIRQRPGGADTPIVFLTALRDVDTFERALRAGGDDFLTKPVRPTELVLRVQAALKLKRLSGELRANFDLLKKQRDDLMRAQLQKERLSSFVVHDLKNPVNAMDLHAQVLLADPSLSPGARESAQHIRSEARTLLRLIYNLLDISKSEEGQLAAKKAPVALPPLFDELADAFAIKARTAEVAIVTAVEVPSAPGDRDLLARILENLIDNAIRHAPPKSQVRIGARGGVDAVELFVADAGPGIPPTQRASIFERFVQLDLEKPATRMGRGLGLAFCKLAAEAHGGSIRVEDANPGTLFAVRIPR